MFDYIKNQLEYIYDMQKDRVYIIGVMSGTSLDGIDLVYVAFDITKQYDFQILASETTAYNKEWYNALKNGFSKSEVALKKLDLLYGDYIADQINTFISKNNITKLDFVASHGHTIFHKPNEGYTLQIGNGQVIAEKLGVKVVCDFRTQDVLLGGQGAPLVPVGDKLLFQEYKYCLNLGGFANVSFDEEGERLAFDICPVNIVMNHYAQKKGLDYDRGGELARRGTVNENMLSALNAIPYYDLQLPKSLGYEFVVDQIFPLLNKFNLSIEDTLRTFVAHIVAQISKAVDGSGNIFITGGGAFNVFLIEELKKQTKCTIIIPAQDIVDFKEALIFALLGLLCIQGKNNCFKTVTGAKKDHSSGKIYDVN